MKNIQGEREMKLYPNPTKGTLMIEIFGGNTEDEINLTLYDGQGKALTAQKVATGLNTLDLTHYPAGWYVMLIQAGNTRKEYKIIKE